MLAPYLTVVALTAQFFSLSHSIKLFGFANQNINKIRWPFIVTIALYLLFKFLILDLVLKYKRIFMVEYMQHY